MAVTLVVRPPNSLSSITLIFKKIEFNQNKGNLVTLGRQSYGNDKMKVNEHVCRKYPYHATELRNAAPLNLPKASTRYRSSWGYQTTIIITQPVQQVFRQPEG
jgi:hypothetical protein